MIKKCIRWVKIYSIIEITVTRRDFFNLLSTKTKPDELDVFLVYVNYYTIMMLIPKKTRRILYISILCYFHIIITKTE
jgi:hypothetical protein